MIKRIILTLTVLVCVVSMLSETAVRTSAQERRTPDYQILVQSLRGNPEAVADLLRNGADPNTPPGPDDKGMTALMFACWKGNDDIVKMLVDAGADVNAVSATGATPLIFAVNAGKPEMANFLLERGARTDAKVQGQSSAISYAVKSGNPQLVALIARRTSPEMINEKNKKGDSLLLALTRTNKPELVQALLEGSPNLEEKDQYGQTALMTASRFGYTGIVTNLLNKGADPNTKDNNGIPALTKASVGKNSEVLKALRLKGAKGSKNR